jgi:hypothetical protein
MKTPDTYIKDETGLYYLRNGVIYCIYYKNLILDLSTIKKVIRNRNLVAEGKPRPLLVDGRGLTYWTREAKIYTYDNEESLRLITAIAPVLNSLPLEISVNWTLQFLPPLIPAKIFTDVQSALNWLEKYKVINQVKDLKAK